MLCMIDRVCRIINMANLHVPRDMLYKKLLLNSIEVQPNNYINNYTVTCQVHPVLAKTGHMYGPFFLKNFLGSYY